MRASKLTSLFKAGRRQRMRGLARWRDELDALEMLLAREPHGQRVWFWEIRRKVLSYLVADRSLAAPPAASAAAAELEPGRSSAASPAHRDCWLAPTVPAIWPAPEQMVRIHGGLHDLAAANETRHAGVQHMAQAAQVARCVRRRADELRRALAQVDASGCSSSALGWPVGAATVEQLHANMRRRAVGACPRCLRRFDEPPPGTCPRCGYRCAGARLTLEDVVTLVATRLELPLDAVRPQDRLDALLEQRCRGAA